MSGDDSNKRSLYEFFRNSPLVGSDLDLKRSGDLPRDIDLADQEQQTYSKSIDQIKENVLALSVADRLQLRDWLETHTIDVRSDSRLGELFQMAINVLGNDESATRWLQKPNRALNGAIPAIHALKSAAAMDEVANVLAAIRFGNIT